VGDALTLHVANAVVAATFAVACFIVLRYFPARRELAIVGFALIFAVLENVLAFGSGVAPPKAVSLVLGILAVLPYLFATVALGVHKGLAFRVPRTALPSLFLTVAGFTAYMAGWTYAWRFIPLQVAIALPILEASLLALSTAQGNRRDLALAVVLVAGAAIYLARIPAVAFLFEPGFTRSELLASDMFTMSMMAIIVNMTAAMLLFLAAVADAILSEYRERSERDPLTGILNRQAFDERVRAVGAGGGMLIMADLDHFKDINDRHGHAVGDEAIRAFAGLLRAVGVLGGRIGGEEFAIFLPGASPAQGVQVAEGLRLAFAMKAIGAAGMQVHATASFGLTTCAPGEALHGCFARADAMLYKAKNSGRNRVCLHDASQPASAFGGGFSPDPAVA
jgi:diguanylate cyclase (GGDEF)-like protein